MIESDTIKPAVAAIAVDIRMVLQYMGIPEQRCPQELLSAAAPAEERAADDETG